jgi:prepilin-type N-terminal cleavage/methylation domain-containing protein
VQHKNKSDFLKNTSPKGFTQASSNGAHGFTLIELLVVVAIIGLLASIVLISLISARAKSRDAKRLSDMAQMNTGLELYFASNKGYPSSTASAQPAGMTAFSGTVPISPQPADGSCATLTYPVGGNAGNYYYVPSGTFYLGSDGVTQVYPAYSYYFCLGAQTGAFPPGIHVLTPSGVQ